MDNKADLLSRVDFGDIDGLYDGRINEYFIDLQYKDSLLKGDKYFVIGRKGTGKSALYNWLHSIQGDEGILVSNKSFSDFPFEKLLKLSDDDFMRPNQYQSIWKHIIYLEFARMIVLDQNNQIDDDWIELNDYLKNIGYNLSELHKDVTRRVEKKDCRLGYDRTLFSSQFSTEKEYRWGNGNITDINNRLRSVIESYLRRNITCQYIVQFDQLDDNYTAYVKNTDYLQCVQSLFKTIYQIDQSFRKVSIPVKAIAYLRSDIYNQFNRHDPESSRWDQYVLKLNWAIINRDDWAKCNLLKLVNARIKNSLPELSNESDPFHYIFNKKEINLSSGQQKCAQDVFKYLVHRTFQRPRDLIQFCIKIQEEIQITKSLSSTTIKNAEKEYSLWLLGEVENEIGPVIEDTEALYELLRLFGRTPYTVSSFRNKYSSYSSSFSGVDAEQMLRYLYSVGIIINVRTNENGKIVEQFSVIRNDRSILNRDLNIRTHPGFYEGLHTSKFLQR